MNYFRYKGDSSLSFSDYKDGFIGLVIVALSSTLITMSLVNIYFKNRYKKWIINAKH
ncbi:MAG: hypothetical protein LBG67_04590 [Campylobacteraceae bacterium]|jgi:hypothetical protein|nr:hypothetical protein [Campylobacteraceae bacterium]